MSIITAKATEALFGELVAGDIRGDAKIIGTRYDECGVKTIAATTRKHNRPNVSGLKSIKLDPQFFSNATRDYENWPVKWWREVFQNAIDAGATTIKCTVEQSGDAWKVSCEDNGKGMSQETLEDKFLALGGTTKTGGTTVGGFGKAKELILYPWIKWEIRSAMWVATGEGGMYRVDKSPSRKPGVRVTVWMPPDKTTREYDAIVCIGRSYLPGINFIVNGKTYKANLAPGRPVSSVENRAEIYYNEKGKTASGYAYSMYIRAGGLYMFDRWLSDRVEGHVIVELSQSSVKLLSANRDSIAEPKLRRDIDKFANQLAADVKSATREKKGMIRKKFRGTGKFSAKQSRDTAAQILYSLGDLEPKGKRVKSKSLPFSAELSGEQQETIIYELGDVFSSEDEKPLSPIKEVTEAILSGLAVGGADSTEAAIRQLSWTPDFYIVNNIENWKVPQKFMPEKMTVGVRKLARLWAEYCRYILVLLGSPVPYGVGFIFDEDVGAAHLREEGEDWVLLNPFQNAKPGSPLYSASDKSHSDWLYAAAVHEVTHMANGILYHDESFAAALTCNVARTAGKVSHREKIRKSITSRGPSGRMGSRSTAASPKSPKDLNVSWHVYERIFSPFILKAMPPSRKDVSLGLAEYPVEDLSVTVDQLVSDFNREPVSIWRKKEYPGGFVVQISDDKESGDYKRYFAKLTAKGLEERIEHARHLYERGSLKEREVAELFLNLTKGW